MIESVLNNVGELLETGIIIYLWYRIDALTKQIEEMK